MSNLYANLTGKYSLEESPTPRWRRAILSSVAYVLGVQIKIGGQPYGASHERHHRTARNTSHYDHGAPPVI